MMGMKINTITMISAGATKLNPASHSCAVLLNTVWRGATGGTTACCAPSVLVAIGCLLRSGSVRLWCCWRTRIDLTPGPSPTGAVSQESQIANRSPSLLAERGGGLIACCGRHRRRAACCPLALAQYLIANAFYRLQGAFWSLVAGKDREDFVIGRVQHGLEARRELPLVRISSAVQEGFKLRELGEPSIRQALPGRHRQTKISPGFHAFRTRQVVDQLERGVFVLAIGRYRIADGERHRRLALWPGG